MKARYIVKWTLNDNVRITNLASLLNKYVDSFIIDDIIGGLDTRHAQIKTILEKKCIENDQKNVEQVTKEYESAKCQYEECQNTLEKTRLEYDNIRHQYQKLQHQGCHTPSDTDPEDATDDE